MLERRLQFPLSLISSFGSEGPGITLEKSDENFLFQCLFHVEQHIDQLRAYRHVEKNWLSKDIKTLTPADIITLAKEINSFAGAALTIVKNENGTAGEFLERGVKITMETGIPDVEFDSAVTFIIKNYEILLQKYGEKVANDYKLFSSLLELECESLKDQPSFKQVDYWLTVLENYKDTPSFQAYRHVIKYVNPDTVATKMEIFAQALVAKIAAQKDPIHCAAFALSQLCDIHCFAHANRRSARIFMNTLLMMLGRAPILIPPHAVSEYYLAIEKSTAQDFSQLTTLLRSYANTKLNFDKKLSEPFMREFEFENQLTMAVTEFKYLCKPQVSGSATEFFVNLTRRYIDSQFYLEKANLFAKSAPKIAKFYYERSKRLAKNNNVNPALGAAILAAQPVVMESSTPPEKLKPIYMIAPHETARLSGDQVKNASLFLLLQSMRLAVLIKDKKNNISLTSLDNWNSLDFLLREAKAMDLKAGEFTIDIIKHPEDNSPRASLVQVYIATMFGEVKNSKGTHEIRVSKSGTVLIQNNKIFMPNALDALDCAPIILFESKFQQCPAKANPLKGYEILEGSKRIKLRTAERQIMRALHAKHKEQPVVIFDNEWTGDFPVLSTEAKDFFAVTAKLDPNSKLFANEVKKVFARLTDEKNYLDEMVREVKFYHKCASGNLYCTLNSFFKKPAPELPDKALALITGYAEGEALADSGCGKIFDFAMLSLNHSDIYIAKTSFHYIDSRVKIEAVNKCLRIMHLHH